ncbi:hypothetical protein DER46DRAFT_573442 [Fusarium sp. MPI-SDFR-AT-0072]|nr:hypothetical protein DER46DRAFT_573442 [Fusarium sp. MPI-SDFR-AT-0072]
MGSSPPTDDTEDGSDGDDDGAGIVDWDNGKPASDGETPELRRGRAAGNEGDTASNPGSGPDSMAETTRPSRIVRAENSAIGGDSCYSSSCWMINCTLSRRVCSCRVIVGSTRGRSGLAPGLLTTIVAPAASSSSVTGGIVSASLGLGCLCCSIGRFDGSDDDDDDDDASVRGSVSTSAVYAVATESILFGEIIGEVGRLISLGLRRLCWDGSNKSLASFVEGFGGGVTSHAPACDLFSPEPRVYGVPLFAIQEE